MPLAVAWVNILTFSSPSPPLPPPPSPSPPSPSHHQLFVSIWYRKWVFRCDAILFNRQGAWECILSSFFLYKIT